MEERKGRNEREGTRESLLPSMRHQSLCRDETLVLDIRVPVRHEFHHARFRAQVFNRSARMNAVRHESLLTMAHDTGGTHFLPLSWNLTN